jgi:fumarate hydratase class II
LKEAGLKLGLVDEATFDRLVRPETMIGRQAE